MRKVTWIHTNKQKACRFTSTRGAVKITFTNKGTYVFLNSKMYFSSDLVAETKDDAISAVYMALDLIEG